MGIVTMVIITIVKTTRGKHGYVTMVKSITSENGCVTMVISTKV